MNSNMTEQLDQLFRMWDRGLCPGAQVLIRQHGKTLYEKCFGYGNLENKLKIHKESIFHVASISKEFTVMSILLLWKEGKLDLDDNIKKYLDEYINIETPITIRQMMNNVSGLRDQWELLFLRGIKINDQIDMDDINTTISLQKSLNFEPQSQYLYSNTGFHLLALIVEKLSQMSFPQFVKERIFTPLGMTHSFVRESFTQIVPDLTYSYQDEGDDTFYYNPLNYALYGPTSVNTCASDLCKVLDEYIHPNVIDPEIIELMKKPVLLSNGKTAESCGGLTAHGPRRGPTARPAASARARRQRSFIKKVNERALRAGFSLLTRPLVFAGYSEEYLKHLMKKAYCLNHFIDNGEMTVAEINDTLRDEFALEIATVDGVVHLYQFEKENSND